MAISYLQSIRLFAFLLFLLSPMLNAEEDPDPWEGFNRSMFAVNEVLDSWVLKPVAQGYQYITPKPVERSVGRFFNNLKEPSVFVSNLLQLKIVDAGIDVSRFLINSTLGFFGVFDVATQLGLQSNNEDFGQVLGSWGVPSGPYIVLPVLGFYTARSLTGEIVTSASGVGYTEWGQTTADKLGLFGGNVIHQRANLLAQEKLIIGDKYIFIRSVYLQRRNFLVNDGKVNNEHDAEFESSLEDGFESDFEQSPTLEAKQPRFSDDDWMFEDSEQTNSQPNKAVPEQNNLNTDLKMDTNTETMP